MIMTQTDRDMLIRIDERVKDMHKVLYGNGKAGLIENFQKIKISHDECLHKKKEYKKTIKWVIGIAVTLLAVYLKAKYNL